MKKRILKKIGTFISLIFYVHLIMLVPIDAAIAQNTAVFKNAEKLKAASDIHKANYYYFKAISEGKNVLAAYYGLADSFYLMRNFPRALSYLDKVLVTEPEHNEALLMRSKILLHQNKPIDAFKDLLILEQNNSDNPQVYHLISGIYSTLGDENAAVVARQKIQKIRTRRAEQGR